MLVSLRAFLNTGLLGDLRTGMARDAVVDLLGEPDAEGCTSRKYRTPGCWLYGSVELFFQQARPHDLRWLQWEAGEKGDFRLNSRVMVADWELRPDMKQTEVESWLCRCGFTYEVTAGESCRLHVPSGVTLSFCEDGRLWSLYTRP